MKIAFNAQPLTDSQKTGVGYCEAEIVRALLKKYPDNSYFFDFFCLGDPEIPISRLSSFNTDIMELNICRFFSDRLYRMLWNFIPLPYRWFFGRKAEITHFFNFHIPPGVSGKTVSVIHDMAYLAFPETVRIKTKVMLNLSLKHSCKRADRVLTVSEFSKREIIKYLSVPEYKITVMPNGVDLNRFRPDIDKALIEKTREAYGVPEKYLLYLGTLEPRKNIERLIEAYARLKSEHPESPVLVLAGRKGWLYDSIFEKVRELRIEQSVIFTGYIADDDTPRLLCGALAFLFPSLYEGFGMPPLESMACGTPVLTSKTSSLPEVVGDAAVLVDPYSIEEISSGMARLVQNESLRNELAEKGIARAKLFSWDRPAEIVMGVYRELLKQDE